MGGASEVQRTLFTRDGDRGGSVSAGEPDTLGMATLCIELGQAFHHKLAGRLSAGMLHWVLFSRFILFWKFCYGNLGDMCLFSLDSFLAS